MFRSNNDFQNQIIENYNEHFTTDYLEFQKKERERKYLNSIFRIPNEDRKNKMMNIKNFNKNNNPNHSSYTNTNMQAAILNLNDFNNSKFNHLNFANPFIIQNNTERPEKYHFTLNQYFPDEIIENNYNNFYYNSYSQRNNDFNPKNKNNPNKRTNAKKNNKNFDYISITNIINNPNFQIEKNPAEFQYNSPEFSSYKSFDDNNLSINQNNKVNYRKQQKKSQKTSNSAINLNPDPNNFFQNNDFPQKNHLTEPINKNKKNKPINKKGFNTIDSAQAYKLRYKNTGYHYNFEFIPQLNNNYIQNSIEQDFVNNNLIDNENNAYIYQNQEYNEQEIQNDNINDNVINQINDNNIENKDNDNKNEFEKEYFYYKENYIPSSRANGINYYQGQDTIKEVNEDMEYSNSEKKSSGDSIQKKKSIKKSNTFVKLKNNHKKINGKLSSSNLKKKSEKAKENNYKTMKNSGMTSNMKNNSKKNSKGNVIKKLDDSKNKIFKKIVNKRTINKKDQKLKQFLYDNNFIKSPELSLDLLNGKRDSSLSNSYKMFDYKQKLKSINNEYDFPLSTIIKNFGLKDDFRIKKNMKKDFLILPKTKKNSRTKKNFNTRFFDKNIKIKTGINEKEKIIKKRKVKTPLPPHTLEKMGFNLF